MQSARRAPREMQTPGNVSCPQQQFDQDNRLCCALQPAFPNILFRLLRCAVYQLSFCLLAGGHAKNTQRKLEVPALGQEDATDDRVRFALCSIGTCYWPSSFFG